MSARFGRNKRRRMREQIEQQANTIQSNLNLVVAQKYRIDNLLNEVAQNNQFIERVSSMVGRYSIVAGKPNSLNIDGKVRDSIRMANPVHVQNYYDTIVPSIMEQKYKIMQILHVEAVRNTFENMIHAKVYFSDKTVGYALSDEALLDLGPDDLADMIAPKIAKMLAKEFGKLK